MGGYPNGACEINDFITVMKKHLYLDDSYIKEACLKEPS